MSIDIDDLSEDELIDLNNRIVARLRFLSEARAHSSMLEFSLGERVAFRPEGRETLFGVVTRYNRKSITVVTEQGQRWNIAPSLLRKVKDIKSAESRRAKVVDLHKK